MSHLTLQSVSQFGYYLPQLKLSCSNAEQRHKRSFSFSTLIGKGIKALKIQPLQWCVLNLNSTLSGSTTTHHISGIIIKHKMLPLFTEVASVFMSGHKGDGFIGADLSQYIHLCMFFAFKVNIIKVQLYICLQSVVKC